MKKLLLVLLLLAAPSASAMPGVVPLATPRPAPALAEGKSARVAGGLRSLISTLRKADAREVVRRLRNHPNLKGIDDVGEAIADVLSGLKGKGSGWRQSLFKGATKADIEDVLVTLTLCRKKGVDAGLLLDTIGRGAKARDFTKKIRVLLDQGDQAEGVEKLIKQLASDGRFPYNIRRGAIHVVEYATSALRTGVKKFEAEVVGGTPLTRRIYDIIHGGISYELKHWKEIPAGWKKILDPALKGVKHEGYMQFLRDLSHHGAEAGQKLRWVVKSADAKTIADLKDAMTKVIRSLDAKQLPAGAKAADFPLLNRALGRLPNDPKLAGLRKLLDDLRDPVKKTLDEAKVRQLLDSIVTGG